MITWQQFAVHQPEMAVFGATRIALRVMFLGTVRADGYPRVHPVTSFIGAGRLFTFMEPTSPKARDLERNPRYAMHSVVVDSDGSTGEFAFSGQARPVLDAVSRAAAVAACPFKPQERYVLFEFFLERVMTNQYVNGTPGPRHWKVSSA